MDISNWAVSIQPRGTDFGQNFDRLKERIKTKIAKYSAGHQKFLPPTPIPLNIRQRRLDPDKVADTDWAIILLHFFDVAGLAGLGKAVQHQAKLHENDPRVKPSKNYQVFNEKDLIHFMMIMASMYPGFIVGLISGDIYRRYVEEPDLRSAINTTHSLKKTSGNYLQAFIQPETIPLETPTNMTALTQASSRIENEDKYKGLTLAQLWRVHNVTKKYLPSSTDKDDIIVHTIDSMFAPLPKDVDYTIGRHKYVHKAHNKSPGNEHKFQEWMAELEEVYINRINDMMLKNPDDPNLHKPMRVSLLEVGYGKDVKARSSAHDEHRSSNSLFTYFQAAAKYVLETDETGNKVEFNIVRFATNLLNRGDSLDDAFKDGTLSDVGMTMLGRTEWFNGGLNPQPGGGAGISKKPLEAMLPYIQEQGDKIFARSTTSRFMLNVSQNCKKLVAMKEVYSITDKEFQEREQKIEDGRKDRQERWRRIQESVLRLERANASRIAKKAAKAGRQVAAPARAPYTAEDDDMLIRD